MVPNIILFAELLGCVSVSLFVMYVYYSFEGGNCEAKSKSAKKGLKETKEIDFAQPVDPQKLNKALTNLQVNVHFKLLIKKMTAFWDIALCSLVEGD
jgi:hypothetical protein